MISLIIRLPAKLVDHLEDGDKRQHDAADHHGEDRRKNNRLADESDQQEADHP